MIQKVAHRIQEVRRRNTGTGSDSSIISSSEQPPVSYSNSPAGGQVDSQGFCVVDETERTDLEQVTEDLFGDFDYENEREEPKHKPLKQEPKRPWREASKDVYEQQLEILQEQLTSTLIEKQTLECKHTPPTHPHTHTHTHTHAVPLTACVQRGLSPPN